MTYQEDKIDFYIDSCSEKYKEHIRGRRYGDIIEKTTAESVTFIVENDKKYTVKFFLSFSFDFENGFHCVNYSEFKFNRKIDNDLKDILIKYIKNNFVDSDRLSC